MNDKSRAKEENRAKEFDGRKDKNASQCKRRETIANVVERNQHHPHISYNMNT